MTDDEESRLLQIINSGAPAACDLDDCRHLETCIRRLMEFAWRAVNPPSEIQDKTDEELVTDCNTLAREFYQMQGYVVPEDYKFYEATHPQERGVWNLAVVAYEHIQGTPIEDALSNIE